MRKRLKAGLALALLVVVATGQDDCATDTGGGGGGDSGNGKPKTASVGDPLTLKGTTYRVNSVRTTKTVGEQTYGTGAKANGRFVIVKLSLTNRKNEPATILEDNIRLIGGNGKNYSVSDDALLALDDQLNILDEIQPDVTEKGSLVYDVPRGAVSGATLQVQDLFSDAKGRVRLGL
jgi:Domain of unknown function (DUF4352)